MAYSQHADISVAALADSLLVTACTCCNLAAACPVMAAVHGHLAGGGIALCLNTSYRVSDVSTTFEHGNLPRGVCPIAEFSQKLIHSVGMLARLLNPELKVSSCLALISGLRSPQDTHLRLPLYDPSCADCS